MEDFWAVGHHSHHYGRCAKRVHCANSRLYLLLFPIDKGVNTQNISSIITPSCGLGTLEEKAAEKILKLVKEVSREMVK